MANEVDTSAEGLENFCRDLDEMVTWSGDPRGRAAATLRALAAAQEPRA